MRVSYVPGCLNGLFAPSSSVRCAAQTSYTGTLAGTNTNHTVRLGFGAQLLLRYKTGASVSANPKYIRVRSFDGGNVGFTMRVWLSASPTATYEGVPDVCKQESTRTPTVITGASYCPILPDTVYYFGLEYAEEVNSRFQVDELSADFL